MTAATAIDAPAFGDLVRTAWDGNIYDTADKLVIELDLTERQAAMLRDVIINAVRLVMRNGVRPHEETILDRPMPVATGKSGAPRFKPVPVDDSPALRFLRDSFSLPDGRFVTWGAATVADHEARLGMLTKLAGGLERTIARHRSVVAQLEELGARCLNDIYTGEAK